MKRTFKVILAAFTVLAAVVGIAVALLFGWLRNPYGLEEERLGPKGNEKFASVTPVENAANYLLFSTYEGNNFVIHLPVPNDYIHPSRTTSRLLKSYAASVTMYYPALNGPFHPSNANLPKCNGYCGGYLRAYISTNKNDARTQDARRLAQLDQERSGNGSLYSFEKLDSAYGLDDHFQIRYPVIEAKSNGSKQSTKEYLFKRDRDGNVQYLFECFPYAPSPDCEVRFNLASRPELLVKINFGRHLIADWGDIIQSVDKKIVSWVPVRIDTTRE